jgi:general secretion pathway protein D
MHYLSRIFVLATCFLLAACAGSRAYEAGRKAMLEGDHDRSLAKLEQAYKADPDNQTYRDAYERQKLIIIAKLLTDAEFLRGSGDLAKAEHNYRRALELDPGNKRARDGLTRIQTAGQNLADVAQAKIDVEAQDFDKAETTLREVLRRDPDQAQARDLMTRIAERREELRRAGPPKSELKSPFSKPITLEFRDASLKSVFEVISRTSGLNFVFDRDVRSDTKINIFVRNTSLDDVVKLILTTNQLDRKLLNENSLLIYPNTPAKQKEYRELVVRSFYLANADVKQAVNLVKGMVKSQDVFIDEKLNLLVVKDTPEAVSVVEKLMQSLDLAEPEVMLELQVLEVSTSKLQQLGIQYPSTVSFGNPAAADGDTDNGSSPGNFRFSDSLVAFTTNPPIIINLLGQDTDAKVLASPRIRVKNREKAKVHIGSRVPVVTTTSTANVGVSSSVSYLDVGLKLDVEPNIYLRQEVAIKVGLEVSNITRTLDIQGTRAYELGTRTTATVLQIKDGETQILAGLINDEDRRSANKIPGLGDIPVLGRLFSSRNDNRTKTEIVLLITPRIVRGLNWPRTAVSDQPVGTDAAIGSVPLRITPTVAGGLAIGPADGRGGRAPMPSQPLPDQPLPGEPLPGQPMPPDSIQDAPPGMVPLPPDAASPLPPNGATPLPATPVEPPNAPATPSPDAAPGGAGPQGAAPSAAPAAGGGIPQQFDDAAMAEQSPSLLVAAPLAAKAGSEVMVSIGVPPGTAATGAGVELGYDPSQLQPIGAAVAAPGRLPIKVQGSASVRFKVLGQQGRTQIRVDNVTGVDASGNATAIAAPPPMDITITP